MLSFFMADDTLAIFEPPLRNSFVVGGKYLERRQVAHPDSTRYMHQKFSTKCTVHFENGNQNAAESL